MRCPKCGKKLGDGAKFCNSCGAKIVPGRKNDYGSTTIEDANDYTDPNGWGEPTDPYRPINNGNSERRGRSRRGRGGSNNDRNRLYIYLAVALGLVIIVIIALTVRLLMGPGGGGEEKTTAASSEATTNTQPSTDTEPAAQPETTTAEKVKTADEIIPAGSLDTAENIKPLVYKNHAYAIYNFNALGLSSFNKCKRYCEKMGGHLAVIGSEGENEAIYDYLVKHDRDHTFIGYTDQEIEGQWVWVDGSANYYENWAGGQPNNKDGREHYAQFNGKNGGTWNDAGFGDQSHRFLCEWE